MATLVLTAEGHPLIGGTLTEQTSLGGDVLIPAGHGFSSSSATGGCDGCPPPSHDASPFLLELGADGSHLHSRLLEVDVKKPELPKWQEVIPQSEHTLQGVSDATVTAGL
mgnify:CR=1 FL=1